MRSFVFSEWFCLKHDVRIYIFLVQACLDFLFFLVCTVVFVDVVARPFLSVQLKMVSVCSEMPICAPARLSEVSPPFFILTGPAPLNSSTANKQRTKENNNNNKNYKIKTKNIR